MANAVPPKRKVECLIFIGMIVISFRLKSVRKLEDPLVGRTSVDRPPGVQPFVVTLKPQCVSKIVDVTDGFTLGSRPQTVIHPIKAADQFKVVNEREIQ